MTDDEAERVLRASPDYRILKRIPANGDWSLPTVADPDVRRAAFLDVETTGRDIDTDEVIELAILPFEYDAKSGAILKICMDEGLFAFREPTIAIPPEVQAIHGISAEDVKGATIAAETVAATLRSVQIIIAHNAAFDRPMVEKHWPLFENKAWACSLTEIDWRGEGRSAGKLDYLLASFGWFFDGHRARVDAEAGIFLLMQQLPISGVRVLHRLLDHARSKTYLIRATGAPFESRNLLKRRGYKWDPGDETRGKSWWIITRDADRELEWLRDEIYGHPIDLVPYPVPPRLRHSGRQYQA
jgi:DNA polymerase-3 subunit epsilon